MMTFGAFQEALRPDAIAAEYDALPEAIRARVTLEQYRWLSGAERHRLVQDETEPDTYQD